MQPKHLSAMLTCLLMAALLAACAAPAAAPTAMPVAPDPLQPTAPGDFKLTIVFDNTTINPQDLKRWGFAAVVDYGDHRLLFDTGGSGSVLLDNLRRIVFSSTGESGAENPRLRSRVTYNSSIVNCAQPGPVVCLGRKERDVFFSLRYPPS